MIRDARPEDARQLAALIRASFEAHLLPYMAYAQHGCDAFLEFQIAHPGSVTDRRYLVAAFDDQLVGFAETTQVDDTGFLSYICVSEQARGRGLARRILGHWLKDLPYSRVALDVFAHNNAARRLYQGLGFEPNSSSLWLRRPLPPALPGLSVRDLHVTHACLTTYGFAQLALLEERVDQVGLLGQSVVRVPDAKSLSDDRLLGKLVGAIPSLREAILIAPSTEGLAAEHEVILESIRMSIDVETLRKSLENYA